MTLTDAENLKALLEADFHLLQLRKQFDALPQRARILELRAKLREVESKLEQVTTMRKENERALRLLHDDEERARIHRQEIQGKIKTATDYKQTTAFSRELEAFGKKVDKIESAALEQMEKLDKINEVAKQVEAAFAKLKAQEAILVEGFKKQGGTLQNEITRETALREAHAAQLPAPLLARYEKAVVAKGGVGAAYLEDDHCSACRMPFSEGQLVKFRGISGITDCPHCHRLLVTF